MFNTEEGTTTTAESEQVEKWREAKALSTVDWHCGGGNVFYCSFTQQETPTHLLHNQAVPVKCQQSALIQMTTP